MPLFLIDLLLKLKALVQEGVSAVTSTPLLRNIAIGVLLAIGFFFAGEHRQSNLDQATLAKASEEAKEAANKQDARLQTQIDAAIAEHTAEDKQLIADQKTALGKYEEHLRDLQTKQVKVPVTVASKTKGGKSIVVYKTVAQCPVDDALLKALSGK